MISCSKDEKQKMKPEITHEERCAIISAWLKCKDDGFDKHMSESISQKRKEMSNYDEDREELILDFKRKGFSSLKGVRGWVEKEMEEELPQKRAEWKKTKGCKKEVLRRTNVKKIKKKKVMDDNEENQEEQTCQIRLTTSVIHMEEGGEEEINRNKRNIRAEESCYMYSKIQ
ncbi:hypothetical protein MKW92_019791 [Papaver armeniacum]|nr:hypothetical protein MKW92_019791 [Papaver armeniacum]